MELIGIYEANFRKLERLLPELQDLPKAISAYAEEAPALHVRVLSRHKYTLTLHLTHRFSTHEIPDFRVRIYHDVRLAEALPARHLPPTPRGRNLFLEKWLDFCAAQGYRFTAIPSFEDA